VTVPVSSRQKQFFARRAEIETLIGGVLRNHPELEVWLFRRTPTILLEPFRGVATFSDGAEAKRAYLGRRDSHVEAGNLGELGPARFGLVTLELPREFRDELFLATVSSKSDWIDASTGSVEDNPTVHNLYKQLTRELNRILFTPVVARNVVFGGTGTYKNIGYSNGAREWTRSGRRLVQEGVRNVEFFVPDGARAD
jgi:hypothetical protein